MLTPDQTLEASDGKLITARKIDKKNNGEKNYEFTVNTIFLENVQLLRFQEMQKIFRRYKSYILNCCFIKCDIIQLYFRFDRIYHRKKTSNENNGFHLKVLKTIPSVQVMVRRHN